MTALRFRGPVLPDGEARTLYVADGRITYEPTSGADTEAEGWIVPGLVDAHCHLGLDDDGAVSAAETEAQAVQDRDAGALLIRDCGSAADTRWIHERDDLPRLIRCGRHIARTKRYIRNYAHEIEPEDLAACVRQEARRGDGWVKIVGDWIDRASGDLAPCWPREALDAAMAAAHDEGARVTAHCFGGECLTDLVEAGIDCIEHATGLTEETVALFARRGVAIVPTLVNIATFPSIAEHAEAKFPVYAKHMRALHARRHDTVRAAYYAGIPVYSGTDAGGSLAHGLVAAEVAELCAAGLPVPEAVGAASWTARRWLGRPSLGEGESADLVVYDTDPLQDVEVLAHPRAVVLRGGMSRR